MGTGKQKKPRITAKDLTEAQITALERAAARELARQGALQPKHFAIHASRRTWLPAQHLDLLNEKLIDLTQGDLKRLRVYEPPRHGKSMFCSAYFPAWFIGDRCARGLPARVILASYEHDFAMSWGARARDALKRVGKELWGLRIGKDRADEWDVAGHEAGMVSAGVGGAITGRGADLFIIDDPVKGPEEAASDTMREKAWAWFTEVALTRLEPGGRMLLIMTRWNEDDLGGRIATREAEIADSIPWTELRLPALAEENDPLGRLPGEALWPQRFPADEDDRIRMGLPAGTETLLQRKRDMGSYRFEALYQQNPGPPEGTLIRKDWWRWYDEVPKRPDGKLDLHECLMSVDCAFKDTKDSSFVVVQVWGRRWAEIYLLDQRRERMDLPATLAAVESMASSWPQAVTKLVEDKANGTAVIQMLQQKMPGMIAVNPQGGKESRASAVLPLLEAGNVYLPKRAPWIEDFVQECSNFPVGRYDDQVDAMSQALVRFLPVMRNAPQPEPEVPMGRSREAIQARVERFIVREPLDEYVY